MRLEGLLLVFPLLFALILALAACGGDGAPSLEEYLQTMDKVDKDVDARFDTLFEGEPESAGVLADGFTDAIAFAREQYEGIEPADEAKDAHETIVSGIKEYQAAFDSAIEDLDRDAPAEDFESIFGSDELTAAEEEFNGGFCAVQKLADDNNIEADVGCEEDGGQDPSTLEPVEATEVLIQDFAFDPPHIQVSVGDTVTWTQGTDGEPHTATADDETFDTGTLVDEGETGEFTFEEAGEFPYFCEVHPEMLGQVTVVE